MPLSIGQALWAIVLPKETTNLIVNPSLEFGTAGWNVPAGDATIGTTSAKQAFGAWALQINYTTTSEYAYNNAGTFAAGSYTLSAYMSGTSGHTLRLLATEASVGAVLGAGSITATGGWDTLSVRFGMPSGTGLQILARHISPSADGTFYLDGMQLESGTFPTTYIDGDQPGGTWTGAPHASTSTRTGQYRGGGSVIALADLGLQVDQMIGVGMPPIEDSSQSYAIIDGAQFQRQRAASRSFTLTAKPIVGTSLADFHVTRRTLIDVFKPDLVTPQQPIRFMYVGGQGTVQIDAYYDKGLELGNMDGPIAENAAITFNAYDPYWHTPIQEGTTLGAYNTFGSANWVVSRDSLGRWGTMGLSGSSVSGEVRSMTIGTDQKVLVGGSFRLAGGTASGNLGLYNPSTNTWGSFAGGTISAGFVYDIGIFPNGTILVVGSYQSIGGTNARHVGYWAGGAFGSYGGTASDAVYAASINATGTAFLGGQFLTMGGTTAPNLAMLANNAFGTLIGQAGGTLDSFVYDLVIGLDQTLYFGGIFTKAGGTTIRGVGQWKQGSFGSMGAGILSSSILALAAMRDGRVAIGGQYGSISGVVTPNIAAWNGVGMQPLAQGFGGPGLSPPSAVYAIMVDSSNSIYISGVGSNAGSVMLPDSIAKYIGGAWVPLDITLGPGVGAGLGGTTFIYTMTQSPSGTIYLGGDFAGSAIYATVAQIVNHGRAIAYPTIRLRNLSSGTARITDIQNATTGESIYFDLALQSQERAVLTLMPGQRSLTSSFRGNIFGAIIPGSNLANWSLLPGTNTVSFFADNASLETSIYWSPQGWSVDAGTIY